MDFIYYVNYFSLLEDRLMNIRKYIAFEEENLNTYSLELASLINDCGSLINGFCFELCENKNPKRHRFTMKDYKKNIYMIIFKKMNWHIVEILFYNHGKN